MIGGLKVLFGAIFVLMIGGTIAASLRRNLFDGGGELLRNPWGVMTLADAYFGFLTFYVWVAWKERTLLSRLIWFVAIMLLGNIAMSFYVLLQLHRLPPGARPADLLLRRKEA